MRRSWRPKRHILAAVAAIGLTALVATGCAAPADEPSPSNTESPSASGPVRGGSLTVVQSGAINSWHPGAISAAQTFQRQQAVYDALLYVDDDGNIVPGIAESLESEDGGVTWVLTLRDGVQFSDGATFDAEAVKFNYDVIAEDGFSGGLAQSLTTEVIDPLHLQITPDEADPTLAYRIAEALPFIASPESLAERGDVYNDPIGAGPFILESSDSQSGERFVRNDNYWDDGKPYVDEFRTVIVSDPAQRTLTVTQGGADSMNGYPFWFTEVEDNPAVRVESMLSGGDRMIIFNTASGFFSDVRARQMAALAMNVDELVQANLSDSSLTGSSNMFPDTSVYYDTQYSIPTNDLAKAQELFDEIRGDQATVKVKLAVPSAPENVRTSELLQLQLQQIEGLEVDLVQITLTDWRGTVMDNDDYEIGFYPGVMGLNPVRTTLPNAFATGARENWTNFSDPEMDETIDRLRQATDEAAVADAVADVQRIVAEQVPIVPFAIDYRAFLLNSKLQDVKLVAPYILISQDVWIED